MKPELLARTGFCGLVGSEDMSCFFLQVGKSGSWWTLDPGKGNQHATVWTCNPLPHTGLWQGVWSGKNGTVARQPRGLKNFFFFLPAVSSWKTGFILSHWVFFRESRSLWSPYFVSAEGRKRTFVSISYFRGDVLTFKEEEVASFWGLCYQLGTAHNEGGLQICC